MFDLPALRALVAGTSPAPFNLSPESVQIILSALHIMQPYNWTGDGDELSEAERDEIQAMVDRLAYEVMSPMVLSVSKVQNAHVGTVLYENTLSAAGAWDVQNISQDYDDLRLELSLRSTKNAPVEQAYLFLNNFTSVTSYRAQMAWDWNGAAFSDDASAPLIALIPGSTANAYLFAQVQVSIAGYAQPSRRRLAVTQFGYAEAYGEQGIGAATVVWSGTLTINRLTIQPAAYPTSLFEAGSQLKIIGYKTTDLVTDVTLT